MKRHSATTTTPTAAEIPALTDRLAEVVAEISKLTFEKKTLESKLEAYGLAHPELHEHLKDEKREGRTITFAGTRHKLPVLFTSDALLASFKSGAPKHSELLLVLKGLDQNPADVLDLFFSRETTFERRIDDGQKFRAVAAELLPPTTAAAFVSACAQVDKHGIKKSSVRFDYKAGEAVEEVAP